MVVGSGDNVLSFAEFSSFLRVLKHQDLGEVRAVLEETASGSSGLYCHLRRNSSSFLL